MDMIVCFSLVYSILFLSMLTAKLWNLYSTSKKLGYSILGAIRIHIIDMLAKSLLGTSIATCLAFAI